MLFIEYPSCSTCKKAKKWLNDNRIEYTDRPIVEVNPTVKELRNGTLKAVYPLRNFLIQTANYTRN